MNNFDCDRQTDRQTDRQRWQCTDGESLEDPVDFNVFIRSQVVIDVLVQTFECPHRVLLVVLIRRVFALNKLYKYKINVL